MQNLDKAKERERMLLKKGRKSAEMSYKLAQIVTDVEIEFKPDDAKKWSLDNRNLDMVFTDLSFKTLAKRSKKLSDKFKKEMQDSLF